ncbi:hypothetical protein PVAP13_4KG326915 [Panicum virgatum]|uniref:Uncharacterized protein n=1 Tax=Panicum virgatum TaxID=38727 RepID=A0A8T0TW91_PANVG|nr:hypothetical protein PVAP13_4KG326915 [Panicum virgatum]
MAGDSKLAAEKESVAADRPRRCISHPTQGPWEEGGQRLATAEESACGRSPARPPSHWRRQPQRPVPSCGNGADPSSRSPCHRLSPPGDDGGEGEIEIGAPIHRRWPPWNQRGQEAAIVAAPAPFTGRSLPPLRTSPHPRFVLRHRGEHQRERRHRTVASRQKMSMIR